MDIKYYIGATQVEEPIGMDALSTRIFRHEHHGISIESSVGELEFYGAAFDLVKYGYENDIDSELGFKAMQRCSADDDYVTVFEGVIDLTTYKELTSDYCSCSAKIAEIGVKTTFNNRTETAVDLKSTQSLDGVALSAYSNLGRSLPMHAKSILFKSNVVTSSETDSSYNAASDADILFFIPKFEANIQELNSIYGTPAAQITKIIPTPNEFINNDSKTAVNVKYKFDLRVKNNENKLLQVAVYRVTDVGGPVPLSMIQVSAFQDIENNTEKDVLFEGTYNLTLTYTDHRFFIFFFHPAGSTFFNIDVKCRVGSFVSYEFLDTASDTTAPLYFVHESLSRVAEIISGLTVKSAFYGRTDSQVNPVITEGGGGFKALTTGLLMRNAVLTDGSTPKLNISFKDLFMNLRAIDNIGWGFETFIEDDEPVLYIIVDKWQYFYKSDVLLSITAPRDKIRRLDPSRIFTRLKTGYDKYGSEDEINSIDTFHTIREYSTKLKALDNQVDAVCKFVACPYAIEFTRRKAIEKTTEQWKYDEDKFIICIEKTTGVYSSEKGVTDSGTTLISPETMYNAKISPLRNATRWASRFYEVTTNVPLAPNMLAGSGNVVAQFKPAIGFDDSCEDALSGVVGVENESLMYVAPVLRPEIIEFAYPLTVSEFEDIKANPYGVIEVDGEECYIQEAQREFATGETNFKLIPKTI